MDKYFDDQAEVFPEVREVFRALKEFRSRRLYFQYSEELVSLLKIPFFLSNDNLVRVYDNAVEPIQEKLSPFYLVRFCIEVVNQIKDLGRRRQFSSQIRDVVKEDEEAKFLAEILYLKVELGYKNSEDFKDLLNKMRLILTVKGEEFDKFCVSQFHLMEIKFFKEEKDYTSFYHAAISFLSHPSGQEIRESDLRVLVFDICRAAIFGKVYSFEGLLGNKFLEKSEITELQLVRECLKCLNEGKIEEFEELSIQRNCMNLDKLEENEKRLRKKVREMRFLRLCTDKANCKIKEIALEEISVACMVPLEFTEIMIMDLICKKLVRGEIDGISGKFLLSWVLPKPLALEELAALRNGLAHWNKKVESVLAKAVEIRDKNSI